MDNGGGVGRDCGLKTEGDAWSGSKDIPLARIGCPVVMTAGTVSRVVGSTRRPNTGTSAGNTSLEFVAALGGEGATLKL